MLRTRARLVALAATLLFAAIGCRELPSHDENGPSAYFDIANFGDSYAAGNAATEGGGDDGYFFQSPDDPRAEADVRQRPAVVTDPDTWFLTKGCLRNHNNYSEELYRLLGSAGAYLNGACSGDTTSEVTNTNGGSGQLNGFTPEQRGEVDLITLHIGGNDLHFADVVAHCFVTILADATQCDQDFDQAESMLEISPTTGVSLLQHLTIGALRKVATDFPNAQVVLVGYPLFYDDDDGEPVLHCEDNSCTVYPQDRLESGLNTLNDQQQEAIDQLNGEFSGRFGFLPLHARFNDEGLFDHHGINGDRELWIQDLGSTVYREEWAHPTAEGHDQIAQALYDMPFVQDAFRDRIRADYPKMSLTNVDGQWYALDNNGQLWTVTADFVRCQQPEGGYDVVEWRDPSQVFVAATNSAPYPDLPGQPGCDPNAMLEGDFLVKTDSTNMPSWVVSFGPQGEKLRSWITGGHYCWVFEDQMGTRRIFDITSLELNTEYQDTGEVFTEPCGTPAHDLIEDEDGQLWVVEHFREGADTRLAIKLEGSILLDCWTSVITPTPWVRAEHPEVTWQFDVIYQDDGGCTPQAWRDNIIRDTSTNAVWYVAYHGLKYRPSSATIESCLLNSGRQIFDIAPLDVEMTRTGPGEILATCP